MPAAQMTAGGEPAIEVIRNVLRTDVVDILRREMTALRPLTRTAAYDAIMNQPTMLDGCFRLFRAQPQLFAEVVVDAERRPVTSDDLALRCGRTLAEVVALVVRAAARRYFRARLPVAAPAARSRPSVLRRLGRAAPPPSPAHPAADSPAERLYHAIRDHLCFEWQVLLIPHYVPLPPERVAALGARLLDVREPAELRALAGDEAGEGDGRPPLLLDSVERVLVKGRETVDAEMLWRVCQQMDLARLFPKRDVTQLRRAVAQVAATGPAAVAALRPVLGNDVRRFIAFLMVAYVTLGEQRYRQAFGEGGQGAAVRRWAERLAAAEVPLPRFDDLKRAYQKVVSTAAAEPVATAGWARGPG